MLEPLVGRRRNGTLFRLAEKRFVQFHKVDAIAELARRVVREEPPPLPRLRTNALPWQVSATSCAIVAFMTGLCDTWLSSQVVAVDDEAQMPRHFVVQQPAPPRSTRAYASTRA
jgi:hypothetical protein